MLQWFQQLLRYPYLHRVKNGNQHNQNFNSNALWEKDLPESLSLKKEYIEWGISTPYYFLKYKFWTT